jgi:hypothetical protein
MHVPDRVSHVILLRELMERFGEPGMIQDFDYCLALMHELTDCQAKMLERLSPTRDDSPRE